MCGILSTVSKASKIIKQNQQLRWDTYQYNTHCLVLVVLPFADHSCDLEFIAIRVDFRAICFLSTLLVYAATDSFHDVVHTLSFDLENWTKILN